jgi:hypothetical protein
LRGFVLDHEDQGFACHRSVSAPAARSYRPPAGAPAWAVFIGHFAGHHVDHLLGDGGRVIAHALDVLGHEMQVHAGRDVARVFHHEGQVFAEQRRIHLVDLDIAVAHVQRQVRVALDIGIEHVLEHQFHLPRHARSEAPVPLTGGMVHDRLGPLGDVLGVVADPFEVGGDAEDRQDGAQVVAIG